MLCILMAFKMKAKVKVQDMATVLACPCWARCVAGFWESQGCARKQQAGGMPRDQEAAWGGPCSSVAALAAAMLLSPRRQPGMSSLG